MEISAETDLSEVNKSGQSLGRKGADTRRRLLDSARTLLSRNGKLTAAGISREAGVSAPTFYLYFENIADIQLSLSDEAGEDMAEILDILAQPWLPSTVSLRSEQLVRAFYAHWDRNRSVLSTRNHQSDLGNGDFDRSRRRAAMPVINALSERIREAQGSGRVSDRDAMARSVIIYAAMERLAARGSARTLQPGDLSDEELIRAEAHVLGLLFRTAPELPAA
jgi:AcrR family transcriptional regulator